MDTCGYLDSDHKYLKSSQKFTLKFKVKKMLKVFYEFNVFVAKCLAHKKHKFSNDFFYLSKLCDFAPSSVCYTILWLPQIYVTNGVLDIYPQLFLSPQKCQKNDFL